MIKKTIKLLKKYDAFDVISIGVFFFIIATLAFFFLRKSKNISVLVRVSSSDNFQDTWLSKPPEWYLEKTKIGLKEKDFLGRTNIEITDIYYYPTNYREETAFVELNMKTIYNKNKDQYTYDGKPLLVGGYQDFELGNLKIRGIIHSIGDKEQEYEVYKIKGEFERKYNEDVGYQTYNASNQANITNQGLLEYIYSNIPEDTSLYDSKNNLILKMTDLQLVPSYREFVTGSQIKRVVDYERKRVFVEALMLSKKVNDRFLFREEDLVRVNSLIPIHTDTLTLSLTVLDIREATDQETEEFFLYSQK